MIKKREQSLAQRVLGAVDLAIDLATLGEYGLEPLTAERACRERPGCSTGWEALATARRGECLRPAAAISSRRPRARA
jgi:hypothetical protein